MSVSPKFPTAAEVQKTVRGLLTAAAWCRAANIVDIADELVGDAVRTLQMFGGREGNEAEVVADDPLAPLPTILVVDDDAFIRESIATTLEDEGYDVACVANGAEAVEWVRQHPDEARLILLDLMMPVMDGVAFLTARRRDPALAALPVVVMSAALGNVALDEYGVADCLAKPLRADRLLSSVEFITAAAT